MLDINDKNNWRFLNGGREMCFRKYIPTKAELDSGFWTGHEYETAVKQGADGFLVRDDSLRESWAGQRAIDYLASLRTYSRFPVANPDEARLQIIHILFP